MKAAPLAKEESEYEYEYDSESVSQSFQGIALPAEITTDLSKRAPESK